MRRLYLHIYVMFVAVGIGALFVSGTVVSLLVDRDSFPPLDPVVAAAQIAGATETELAAVVATTAAKLEADVVVWDAEGTVLARVGEVPYGPPGVVRRFASFGYRFDLPDGRRAGTLQRQPERGWVGLAWLGVLALAVAVGCYPVARRVTRRLELVQQAVQRWGDGELSARVPVLGRDEVAQVAQSFNQAAAEVERLFEAQRRTLASASHELRSPLARLRVAVELAAEGLAPEGWTTRAAADIEDLDATVGDLLQVGRMQALDGPPHPEDLDLFQLVTEQLADRPSVTVQGTSLPMRGDRRLLQRLVRNLVDNAERYGAPPIVVTVRDGGIEVADQGAGIDDAFLDRIFEPFVRPPHHDEGRDGGVGLGLYLVREIARSHGGDVRYVRGDQTGARFVVELETVR